MTWLILFLWYLSGWVGVLLVRWEEVARQRRYRYAGYDDPWWCVTPKHIFYSALLAWFGPIFLGFGYILFLTSDDIQTFKHSWWNRPICKRKK
jgi:hypothetical protein